MSMPSPFEMGRAVGGNISGGISEGLESSRIDHILQQAQASGDPNQVQNIMNQIITSVSPEKRPIVSEALQNRHQQLQQQKSKESVSQITGLPIEQLQGLTDKQIEMVLQEKYKATKELEKEKVTERSDIRKARIKSEYESPEIKEYRKNLGSREDNATSLYPALENAKQYSKDPSRFVPGTAAYKSLKDLSTRAFAFYKPLFGGRLTQKEFMESMQSLSLNRSLPSGFEQGVNIIESMIKQADMEGEFFNNLLSEGVSPFEAKRETKKYMKENANEIIAILQKSNQQQLTDEQLDAALKKTGGDVNAAMQLLSGQ